MSEVNKSTDSIALVFPGQGSQYVGMGREICEDYPEAKDVLRQADSLLGFGLSELCFDGPEELLNRTDNAQPAILTVSMALLRVLERNHPGLWDAVSFLAGHSLGEYTALAAADSLPFEKALRLVRQRGLQMRHAGDRGEGGMLAIIGLGKEQVQELCDEVMAASGGTDDRPKGAWVANHNTPTQIVVSGTDEALPRVEELAKARGARRVVRLAVSIGSHCPLMRPAAEELRPLVEDTEILPPRIAVLGNISGAPLTSADGIRDELVQQLTSQVRWAESIQHILSHGTSTFIEVGPGRVLGGLIRRIDRSARTISLDDGETGRKLLDGKGELAWI